MSRAASSVNSFSALFSRREKTDAEAPARAKSARDLRGTSSTFQGFDQGLVWACVALLAWGLVMVYSATVALPDSARFSNLLRHHFAVRHAMWIGLSFALAFVVLQIRMDWWERGAIVLVLCVMGLLVAVLIPGVGIGAKGAYRWLGFGPIRFQPSELMKLAMLLYAASYVVRRMANDVRRRKTMLEAVKEVLPFSIVLGLVGILLRLQPDLGATLVIAVVALGILFMGGLEIRLIAIMLVLGVVVFATWIWTSAFRFERVLAYLDPWNKDHVLNKGYQLTNALIALGRGEVFGVGLGGSWEKLHWLSEAHTDFLTAIIGEEFGLVGIASLIFMFFWITRRIMLIGRQAIALDRVFSGLVAQGVALWLGFQAFFNIGVNLGALPTKGLTLPFMSYGGSAIMMNIVAIALVLRVDIENRRLMRGGRR